MADLGELRERMRQFSAERDWGQFHDPKSVLLALVGEVGELAELFQWVPADDARQLARYQSSAALGEVPPRARETGVRLPPPPLQTGEPISPVAA